MPTPQFTPNPDWKPMTAEVAQAMAHRVAEVWKIKKREYTQGNNPCRLCTHPDRETIDRMLLSGAQIVAIREEMGVVGKVKAQSWMPGRFFKHRDNHLMPFIEREIKPASLALFELPYPADGSRDRKDWWYLMRYYGLSEQAFKNGNLMVALNCLRSMREMDVEIMSRAKEPKQIEGEVQPALTETFPNHDDRLSRAFARSAAPKPEVSDAPIETESSRVTE
jgi:hypothetical protein